MQISWTLLIWSALFALLVRKAVERAVWRGQMPDPVHTSVFSALLAVLGMHSAGRRRLARIIAGFLLPVVYALVFHFLSRADAYTGFLLGAVHALAVPLLLLAATPGGSRRSRRIELTGRAGWRGTVSLLASRVLYGALLGYLYVVPAH